MFARFFSSLFARATSRKSIYKVRRHLAARSHFFRHQPRVEWLEERALLAADVEVSKSGPATAIAGTQATYTVTVTNLGPNEAVGVILIDTIPAGATFDSFGADTNWSGCSPTQAGLIGCSNTTLASGA